MKNKKQIILKYLLIPLMGFILFSMSGYGQIWKKIKEAVKEEVKESAKEIAREKAQELKDSAIARVQKWANDYDPAELNYAVSFSDNSGFYESEDKFEKYKRSLVGFAVSEGSLTDKLTEKAQNMDAEDFNHAGELFYVSNRFRSAERSFKTALAVLERQGKNQLRNRSTCKK